MKKQQGMTVVGMLLTMACVAILAVLVVRVMPVYLENWQLNSAVNSLKDIPASDLSEDKMANIDVIKSKLQKQFYINGMEVDDKGISVLPKHDNVYEVKIKYTVNKPLIANVHLLFDFEIDKEVTVGTN